MRLMNLSSLIPLLLLLGLPVEGQLAEARANDDGKVVDYVVMRQPDWTFESAKEYSDAFLARFEGKRNLVRLIMVSTTADARRVIGRGANLHFDGYRDAIEGMQRRRVTGPVGYLFSVDNRATLTFRHGTDLRVEQLRGEGDPTVVLAGGVSVKILQIRLDRYSSGYNFHIYAMVKSPIAVAVVDGLTQRIAGMTQADNIFLKVRADPWFFEDAEYPEAAPWLEYIDPPVEADYDVRRQISCWIFPGQKSCTTQDLNP